jgi:D-alanyl-D-alanine carboxypeptidase/D-alanyl-D-alanine-endopeptidase (penicillin-binding protein 4)
MKKMIMLLGSFFVTGILIAQNLSDRLKEGMAALLKDEQFTYAITGMMVTDAESGQQIYSWNADIGLAPASCQKVITSAASFALLKPEFRYQTRFTLRFQGDSSFLVLNPSGDPSLGSDRWSATGSAALLNSLASALEKRKPVNLSQTILTTGADLDFQRIPDGWIWQDIGNYYGACAGSFNWMENKFDWLLRSGNNSGDPVEIIRFVPDCDIKSISNLIRTGEKGSGDKAYVYTNPGVKSYAASGTIPPNQENFKITAAMHRPEDFFVSALNDQLSKGFHVHGIKSFRFGNKVKVKKEDELLMPYFSPSLDSLNYWFMKKSINLYGEVFLKTIALQENKPGITDSGVAVIRRFWQQNGISQGAIKIIDGSGLSPANRITAHALHQVLTYTIKQNWFASFKNALPVINGIIMKDGYISGVRSYAGYVKQNSGRVLIFAFIANNIDGNPVAAKEKIWKLLDLLK